MVAFKQRGNWWVNLGCIATVIVVLLLCAMAIAGWFIERSATDDWAIT